MTQFSYKATGNDGKHVTGTVDSHSLQGAREAVIAMGLDPIEIFQTPLAHGSQAPSAAKRDAAPYLPLFETMRLYAGWLLAWYALIYCIGAYQFFKDLPFRIPYAESLFLSPLVLSFTFAAYLFLLLSTLYKAFGKKKIVAFILFVIGVAIFLLYRMNVQ